MSTTEINWEKCNEKQRQFLRLCIFEQKKYAEISKEMIIPLKTVRLWYEELKPIRVEMAKARRIVVSKKMNLNQQEEFFHKWRSMTRRCEYCKITEDDLKKLHNLTGKREVVNKRTQRGKTLELDRKEPNEPYDNLDNLVWACYWCNNAKTDTFTQEEFIPVGNAIAAIWKNRLTGGHE